MDKKLVILGGAIVVFVIVLVLFLVLGNKGNKTKPTAATSPTNKLVIWDSFDKEDDLTPLVQSFKNKNTSVDVEFVKKNPANYEVESINAIASGKGPDIWIIPSNWMSKDQSKLLAMPEKSLDKKKTNCNAYKDLFVSVAYKDNCVSDQVYGVPLFMDSLSLFRNTDFFNHKYQQYIKDHPNVDQEKLSQILLNPPKTWDDVATLIQYSGQDSIAIGGSNVKHASDILTALMLQYGAQMTSDDQRNALFHTANNLFNPSSAYPGTAALNFYVSFAMNKNPHYDWDPKADNSYDRFAKGQLGIMIDYNQEQKLLETENNLSIKASALPQIKGSQNPQDLAYYQIMTVPKSSANSTLAWKFIQNTITNQSVMDQYQTKLGLGTALKTNSTDWQTTQNKIASSWFNPDPAQVEKIFNSAIDQVVSGGNPQTAIEGAAAEVTKLLGKLKT